MMRGKNLLVIMLICLFAASVWARDYNALKNRLKYLSDIPEVSWVEFEKNTVYIGFNPVPRDLGKIVRGAAFFGNKALGFGVHIWAIDASKYNINWRPGNGSYLCEATARSGKVQDCSCR